MLDINSTINLNAGVPEFKKIKVGVKKLDDAILDLGTFNKYRPRLPWGDKHAIFKAIMENDYKTLRAFSRFFYKSNGIYKKLCEYIAFMYRYDWYIVPEILDDKTKEQIKVLIDQDFMKDVKVRIMADCHAGAGCVIGTTLEIKDKIVPNLVGVDIGCGMLCVNLGKIQIDFEKLDNFIHNNIPAGMNVNEEITPSTVVLEDLKCINEINKITYS